jgi:AcrR family transcriptional regulator
MTAIRGARERARAEITAAIKEEARRQLADQGATKLSLRAVARELGMVSSALYRYFPSRDELLTALIVDAYNAVGDAAERALREGGGPDAAPLARWTAVCRAVRGWALAHPHEYALIYGSPVPGYAAPQDTVVPASRVGLALISVVRDARAAGQLRTPEPPEPPDAAAEVPPEVRADLAALRARLAEPPAGGANGTAAQAAAGGEDVLNERLIAAWAELFGLLSFELFGQFNRVIEARDAFFDLAVCRLGRELGLRGRDRGRDAAAGREYV